LSKEVVRVPEPEARRAIVRALTRRGLGAVDAEVVADALVEAELRGRATHGVMRLRRVAEACVALKERPRLALDRGPAAGIDGAHHLGYVACRMAADEAVARARRHGLALVGVRRARHCGMLGYYVDRIAREGFVGLAFADCIALVAPWGGVDKVLGTNPLAAAFPRAPHPIVIDMGTAAITYGDVILARAAGEPLPEGAAVDAEGRPATDPARVREGALLPMAGAKGYALALLVQLLAGPFCGADGVPPDYDAYGALFLAARKDLLAPAERVDAEVEALVGAIKASRRADGVAEILLPGERAARERERRLREGIPLPATLWREVLALAEGALPAG